MLRVVERMREEEGEHESAPHVVVGSQMVVVVVVGAYRTSSRE
jgi:hypothetical protein